MTRTRDPPISPRDQEQGVLFRPLNASTAMRTLKNPRYAGAYAYGQRVYSRTIDGKKTMRNRPEAEWLACIPDAHPGYITWNQFQENLKRLQLNGHGYETARASPPREGAALLQGRAICGRCGQYMRARYRDARGRLESWYVCDRPTAAHHLPSCQSIAGTPIDQAVGTLIAETMTPTAVALALEIRKEIETRFAEADALRCRAVERAQVDADLAQRRFMKVDPNNRLVADTLEANWNEKLRALAKARDEREQARRGDQTMIDDALCERLVAMTEDFNRIWTDSAVANRERKRMLAHIIEDATLVKNAADGTTKIHVRFKGGRVEMLTTINPKPSCEKVKTAPHIVALVNELLDHHLYAEIAQILNARGLHPGGSAWPGRQNAEFTALRVQYVVHTYGLRSRFDRLRDRGRLTKKELAARLAIHEHTLVSWVGHGIIKAHAYSRNRWLYEEPANPPKKRGSRWNRLVAHTTTTRDPKSKRTRPASRNERGAV